MLRQSWFVAGVAFWLALIQVSIAASQIVLAVLICAWAWLAARGEVKVPALPVDHPFLLYAGFSLLSASFSFDPMLSLSACKKLVLLVVPYMLVSAVRPRHLDKLVLVLIFYS